MAKSELRFLSSNNVFESSKFCFKINQLSGFLFLTIRKDRSGVYYSTTTALDLIWLLVSLASASWLFFIVLQTPLEITSRSTILDIGIYLNSKLSALQPILFMLLNFLNRKEFFGIVESFHWIDIRVSNYFVK